MKKVIPQRKILQSVAEYSIQLFLILLPLLIMIAVLSCDNFSKGVNNTEAVLVMIINWLFWWQNIIFEVCSVERLGRMLSENLFVQSE